MTNDETHKDQELELAKHERDKFHDKVHSEYENLAAFKAHALSNKWDFSQKRIHVAGIPYKITQSKDLQFSEVIAGKTPGVVIYSQAGRAWAREGRKVGLGPWIVIVWRKMNGNILKPANVITTRPHVFSDRIKNTLGEAIDTEQKDNVIGNHARVKITSLPNSSEIEALVDTGATLCSLHADRYKTDGQSVHFTCKQLSNSVITMPLITQMAVKSGDGGTEYRPVIELNIRVNGKIVQGVQFNLNNRSHMDHSILLGANFLKQAKLLIDPNMTTESTEEVVEQEVDWDSLAEEIASLLAESVDLEKDDGISTNDIVSVMMKSNITLGDLVKQIRRLEYAQDDTNV